MFQENRRRTLKVILVLVKIHYIDFLKILLFSVVNVKNCRKVYNISVKFLKKFKFLFYSNQYNLLNISPIALKYHLFYLKFNGL